MVTNLKKNIILFVHSTMMMLTPFLSKYCYKYWQLISGKKTPSLIDLLQYMKQLNPSQFPMFSEIVTLLKIVLVNPSTNAASERLFSVMRRIKTPDSVCCILVWCSSRISCPISNSGRPYNFY